MRRLSLPAVLLTAALVGCNDQSTAPKDALHPGSAALASHSVSTKFVAHLSGSEHEPDVDTRAQGQIQLTLSADGQSLHYKLITSNIENVLMAHLHVASAGINGPVTVWLYPSPSNKSPELIPGRTNGILAEGVITPQDIDVSKLPGTSADPMVRLLDAIQSGSIYVNVHTQQNRPGELRGQVQVAG